MCELQHSDGLQLLAKCVGNVIMFTILLDYDNCLSLHFCHLDRNETPILLFPSKNSFFL